MASNRNSDNYGLIILAIVIIIFIAIGLAIRIAQWLLPFVFILSLIFILVWIFLKDGMGNKYSTLLKMGIIGLIISFLLFEIGYGFGNTDFGRASVNATKTILG